MPAAALDAKCVIMVHHCPTSLKKYSILLHFHLGMGHLCFCTLLYQFEIKPPQDSHEMDN